MQTSNNNTTTISVAFVSDTLFLSFYILHNAYGKECVDYDKSGNTIVIRCDSSFGNVINNINDQSVLERLGEDGEYLLNANLEVRNGVTFAITSSSNDDDNSGDGVKWLKIAGSNGITVYGRIEISGVKITSWDKEADSPISQNNDGSIPRAFVNLRGSEGGLINSSEIAYLGYDETGRRGFDLAGDDQPSHDLQITNSSFHHMWMAFYSNGAYDIVIDGTEYHNNIKYALDPHTGTHDMNITNNYLHDNRIGAICSDRCYNILIEGNAVYNNTHIGIFFSRNMHDSIARDNHISNSDIGIEISESPDNQIYNNTIEGTTSAGILLRNPQNPDDGLTKNNQVYNNTITSFAGDGIRETRSHNNILRDNKLYTVPLQ